MKERLRQARRTEDGRKKHYEAQLKWMSVPANAERKRVADERYHSKPEVKQAKRDYQRRRRAEKTAIARVATAFAHLLAGTEMPMAEMRA